MWWSWQIYRCLTWTSTKLIFMVELSASAIPLGMYECYNIHVTILQRCLVYSKLLFLNCYRLSNKENNKILLFQYYEILHKFSVELIICIGSFKDTVEDILELNSKVCKLKMEWTFSNLGKKLTCLCLQGNSWTFVFLIAPYKHA